MKTLEDTERQLPHLEHRHVVWSSRHQLPPEVAEELGDLPCKMRPYVRAMIKVGEKKLGELAKKIKVSKDTLYDVRLRTCEYLGHQSPLVRMLYPKFAAFASIDDERRCGRCGLRGHGSEFCDLPGIDFYASRRYE